MKRSTVLLGALGAIAGIAVAATLTACGDIEPLTLQPLPKIEHTVSFVGNAYDGVSGARVTDYTLKLEVGSTLTTGSIDPEGRYTAGNISPWDDFTVIIAAGGFRAFLSHNANVGLPAELTGSDAIDDISTHQTLHYDAYLFPIDLLAPAVTFTVKTEVPDETPSGKIRLRPTSASVLADDGSETPGGVPGQLWTNDEDLQATTILRDLSSGKLTLKAGELIYGVTYQVDIYEVAGYQPFKAYYQAGIETDKTFTLVEEVTEPIAVLTSNASSCTPPSSPSSTKSAQVTLQLNHTVELAESSYSGGALEAIDDNLQISSPDSNMDMTTNVLWGDIDSATQARGVTLTVSGSTVQLEWNPSAGLETKDAGDPIEWVRYGGLSQISIQRVGKPGSAITLSSLFGASQITCDG